MAAIVARELAVDVGDDSGLRGAGEIVGGNDLVAKSGERAGMAVAEEIPRGAGAPVTANDGCRTAESACQGKLPPG